MEKILGRLIPIFLIIFCLNFSVSYAEECRQGPFIAGSVETSSAYDAAVSGNYVYVADDEAGLKVIDIHTPTSPVTVGHVNTSGSANGVTVSGKYVYLSAGSAGLYVIDINNPASPQVTGSVTTYSANAVAVSGTYAYVADWYGGLKIIDISDKVSPHIVASVNIQHALDVKVSGNHAYVAAWTEGLLVVDISAPESPEITASVGADYATGVAVSGTHAYVACGEGLKVIDIGDSAFPHPIGSVTTFSAKDVTVSGSYAYVADFSKGLKVIDLTDPVFPEIVGAVDTDGDAYGICVSANFAYVAYFTKGLKVIDISDPTSPPLVGAFDTDNARAVTILENYSFVADGSAGLKVINVHNPAAPHITGTVDTDDARAVTVSGNYAYIADGISGLKIIDIQNLASPYIAGTFDTNNAYSAAVSGNKAYVADGNAGLKVIDITDPASPHITGSVDTHNAYHVSVSGIYAYVADGSAGLKVFDISSSDPPSLTGSVDTHDARSVIVSDNYAYLADGSAGLKVIDVSDKEWPHIVGIIDTDGTVQGISVSGIYAYVADGNGGLKIIDISNFSFPSLTGSVLTHNAYDVTISGTFAYVADGNEGLKIIDISCEQQTGTPFISVETAPYNFGSIPVKTTSNPHSLTISNTGSAPLIVGRISLTGTDLSMFKIQGDNCSQKTVKPSNTCTVNVVFSPLSKNVHEARLSIASNTPDNPTTNILLKGTGISHNAEVYSQKYTLTIDEIPPQNSETISGTGISCPPDCIEKYDAQTTVTLTASNDDGYIFDYWKGCIPGTEFNKCTIKMNSDMHVKAHFYSVSTDNYNLSNVGIVSDTFSVWADFLIDSKDSKNICKTYLFDVYESHEDESKGAVQKECLYLNESPNSNRYKITFQINPDVENPLAAYFENGHVHICEKSNPLNCTNLKGLKQFSVYGTTFDITKHAWQFKNGGWKLPKQKDDFWYLATRIEDYLDEEKQDRFWKGIGYYNDWWIFDKTPRGLCYGLVHSAIANFTHSGNRAWGTGSIRNWDNDILRHWPGKHAQEPFKPFQNNHSSIFETYDPSYGWTVQSAKKIMYYYAAQAGITGSNWVGKDRSLHGWDSFSSQGTREKLYENLLKKGAPVSLVIKFRNTANNNQNAHAVAVTQFISWNGHDKFLLWDNETPFSQKNNGYGPYLEWYISDSLDYEKSFVQEKNKFIDYVKRSEGMNRTKHVQKNKYVLTELPYFLPPGCGDSQNIYNLWLEECAGFTDSAEKAMVLHKDKAQTLQKRIDYLFPNHIEITIIGGYVDNLINASTGETVPLIPFGDMNPSQATIRHSLDRVMSVLHLPCKGTYYIEATKYSEIPGLKVFVTVPNTDGTVEKINYKNVETGEHDKTHIAFLAGRNNSHKGITRSATKVYPKKQASQPDDVYKPDYDNVLDTHIFSPQSLSAVYAKGIVYLQWNNVSHPELLKVLIIRKEGAFPRTPHDGIIVYEGLEEKTNDKDVDQDKLYYYAAYSKDRSFKFSDPVYVGINTNSYSVYGKVTLTTGEALQNTQIVIKDSDGKIINQALSDTQGKYALSNLNKGVYTLKASHESHEIKNPVRKITIDEHNLIENFKAIAKPTLTLLFNNPVVIVGNKINILWTYRHIDNNEEVNIELNRGDAWETIESDVPILNGELYWKIDGPAAKSALVRVSLSRDPSVSDEAVCEIKGSRVLTVQKAGTESGTIISTPSGIKCGENCDEIFPENTQVTLTAKPEPGSTFAGWSDDECSGTEKCVLLMDEDKQVTAIFEEADNEYTLSVIISGEGTVTSTPLGIECGMDCEQNFIEGTDVTLTALPGPDSLITVWSGHCKENQEQCTVAMKSDVTINVEFASTPVYPDKGTIRTKFTVIASSFTIEKKPTIFLLNPISLQKHMVKVLRWTNTHSECQLTNKLTPGEYIVMVKPGGTDASLTEVGMFTVKSPEIHSLEDLSNQKGAQIAVIGDFFSIVKGKVIVECEKNGVFNKTNCPVKKTNWTMNKILFSLPFDIPDGTECNLIIENKIDSVKEEDIFKVRN